MGIKRSSVPKWMNQLVDTQPVMMDGKLVFANFPVTPRHRLIMVCGQAWFDSSGMRAISAMNCRFENIREHRWELISPFERQKIKNERKFEVPKNVHVVQKIDDQNATQSEPAKATGKVLQFKNTR